MNLDEITELLEEQGVDKNDLAIASAAGVIGIGVSIHVWRRYGPKAYMKFTLYMAFVGIMNTIMFGRREKRMCLKAQNDTMEEIAATLDLPVMHQDGHVLIGDPRSIEGYKVPDGINWPRFEGADFHRS